MDFGGGRKRKVRWFFCVPGALPLDTPNAFASLNWVDKGDWDGLGPGEDSNAARPWSNGALPNPEMNGRKPLCGPPEWWANGVPATAPDLFYGLDSVPACCRDPRLYILEGNLGIAMGPSRDWNPLAKRLTGNVQLKSSMSSVKGVGHYERGTIEIKASIKE